MDGRRNRKDFRQLGFDREKRQTNGMLLRLWNSTPTVRKISIKNLQAKYRKIEANEVRFEKILCEDADYLIIAYGSAARICQKSIELAREAGIKIGLLRPITLYPFPTQAIAEMCGQIKGMLTVEMSAGQMVEDVRLAVNGRVKVEHYGRMGGVVPTPEEIVEALKNNFEL